MEQNNELNYISFIHTKDGSTGLYNSSVDDIYHSVFGAKEEAEEKFIKPLCFEKNFFNKKQIKILDICYGIGYNSKAILKKIIQTKYKGEIFIDALEYDKNLVLISPFIKDGYFNRYPEISIYLLYALLNDKSFAQNTIKQLITSKQNKRFFTPFYRLFIKRLNYFKGNYNPKSIKQALLHNIYYHCVSKRLKKCHKPLKYNKISLTPYFQDARQSVLNINNQYDIVFLDAFTPTKLPTLWTIDFFIKLHKLMSDDALLVTYSNSAAVRHAMIDAGFYVGKIFDKNNRASGTIASKNQSLIEHPLNDFDLGLLKTSAGVYYKDPNLNWSSEEILSEHEKRRKELNLQSSSSYLKQHKSIKEGKCTM